MGASGWEEVLSITISVCRPLAWGPPGPQRWRNPLRRYRAAAFLLSLATIRRALRRLAAVPTARETPVAARVASAPLLERPDGCLSVLNNTDLLTSEGSLVRSQLRPPGQRNFQV